MERGMTFEDGGDYETKEWDLGSMDSRDKRLDWSREEIPILGLKPEWENMVEGGFP